MIWRRVRSDLEAAIAAAAEFEEKLSQANIAVTSPCGSVKATGDATGTPYRIEFVGKKPHEMSTERLEAVLAATLTASARAPIEARNRFYDRLRIGGDTVAGWRQHPPPPNHPVTVALMALKTFPMRWALGQRNGEGDDHGR